MIRILWKLIIINYGINDNLLELTKEKEDKMCTLRE